MKRNRRLAVFFEMLLSLLRGKTSLIDALQVLSSQDDSTRTKDIAPEILAHMKKGMMFSDSLAAVSRGSWHIPQLYIALIRASEMTGTIDQVLQEIHEDMKQKQKAGENLAAVLVYPLFIIVVAFIGSFAVIFKGIPLFVQSGFVSKEVINSAIFGVAEAGIFLFISGGLLAVLFYMFFLKESPEYKIFYLLSFLLKAGVPLNDALSQCIESLGDTKPGQALFLIKKEITAGSRLCHAFGKRTLFSPYIIKWLSIADENGRLDEICRDIADYLRQKNIQRRELAVKCTEPATIIATGIYLLILVQNVIAPLLTYAGGLL
jgi:type II secretory pathway component PulF